MTIDNTCLYELAAQLDFAASNDNIFLFLYINRINNALDGSTNVLFLLKISDYCKIKLIIPIMALKVIYNLELLILF